MPEKNEEDIPVNKNYSPEAVVNLVENLDNLAALADYMRKVISQISQALAILYLKTTERREDHEEKEQ